MKQGSFTLIRKTSPPSPSMRPISKLRDGLLLELKWCRWHVVSENQWHQRISRCGQILFSKKLQVCYLSTWCACQKYFPSTDNETFWKQNGLLIWIINESVASMGHNIVLIMQAYLNSGSSAWTDFMVKSKLIPILCYRIKQDTYGFTELSLHLLDRELCYCSFTKR